MYIAPTIIYFLGYLAIRISPCGKIDTFLGFAAMGISNGVLLTSSSKPIPNELGGKFAGQVYAYTNTICNIGSLVCKCLKPFPTHNKHTQNKHYIGKRKISEK